MPAPPIVKADLHTHTTASDGALGPAALCAAAAEAGVELLAITDHDTLDAYAALPIALPERLRVVPGVEFSTAWNGVGIHVVGLGVRVDSAAMHEAVCAQRKARAARAVSIARALCRHGLPDLHAAACDRAGRDTPGRPHFAAALVAAEAVRDEAQAFKRYLGAGKAGDVKAHWAELATVTAWIRDSGGIAVLAHPAKYRLTRAKLRRLLRAFQAADGEALEVVSGRQDLNLTRELGALANEYGLYASCGSDFHRPGQPWAALGAAPPLPEVCRPVWSALAPGGIGRVS